ncbi:MAG: endonuclease III [Firmicutes bacterium]|nr:endonuclease III [Bacillota bacterium]MBR6503990.1 endonuclease III [Bacillota bacterium]
MDWTDNDTKILLEEMRRTYPAPECALEFQDRFQLLIAVILSAQTTDKQVNVVTKDLFRKYPDAASLAAADPAEVEETIRRIGMYKTKAKNITAAARMLMEAYGGEVPEDFDELVKLPGVGRKTANVVLAVGCGVPAIPVDTHVFRVSNRIGIVCEKDVLKTELALMERLPEDTWIDMHHALIWHGRRICKARRPECDICPIADICRYTNGEKE